MAPAQAGFRLGPARNVVALIKAGAGWRKVAIVRLLNICIDFNLIRGFQGALIVLVMEQFRCGFGRSAKEFGLRKRGPAAD